MVDPHDALPHPPLRAAAPRDAPLRNDGSRQDPGEAAPLCFIDIIYIMLYAAMNRLSGGGS